jgi:hypothetical protein
LLALKDQGGLPLLEWGYPVLIATLLQATVASLILVVLPLRLGQREIRDAETARRLRAAVAVYFTAIGLGFMFIEIAFIQKFVLFLAHPLYAVGVVLAHSWHLADWGATVRGASRRRDVEGGTMRWHGSQQALPRFLSLVAAGDLPICCAPRSRADHNLDRADRPRFCDGDAVSLGLTRLASGAKALIPMGLGAQRKRVGDCGVLATVRDPPRIRPGDHARGRAVRRCAAAWAPVPS